MQEMKAFLKIRFNYGKDIEALKNYRSVKNMFIDLDQAIKLIQEGRVLHIAADDSLLKQLPKGKWIAGTTLILLRSRAELLPRIDYLLMKLPAQLIIKLQCTIKTMYLT